MRNLRLLSACLLVLLLHAGCENVQPDLAVEATSTLGAYSSRPSPTSTSISSVPATIAPSGPTATPFAHIVQQGETLLGIAIRYGVTLDDLLIVNPSVDPRILSVGQNVLIPGPGGEPVTLLLPTPTPVPLQVGQTHCFPATGDTVRCLAKITNSLTSPLEGIAVQISLFDAIGDPIGQSNAYAMTRWLPKDQSTVLEATFNVDLRSIAATQLDILSAVQVSNLDERLVPVEVTQLNVDRLVDSHLYRFEGLIEKLDEGQEGTVFITIQAFGYNASGEPVGSKTLQVQIQSEEFPYSFEIPLFSLGGKIDEFNLFIEAQRLLTAE